MKKFTIVKLIYLVSTFSALAVSTLAGTEIDLETRLAKLESAAAASQSNADNAWVLACSALVLLMTIPGLALFYGGLVRQKNALATMKKSLFMVGIVTVIWALFGYSLAFSEGNSIIGTLHYAFLNGVGAEPNADYAATIPQLSFMIFQLMFAIITPALITGAFAERIKFKAMVVFSTLWMLVVYLPLAHMVWGKGGFFNAVLGGAIPALDFAGGTVVHISSGFSALICVLYIGKRIDFDNTPTTPHNLVLSVIGAGLLWFGWFGFNAGSALTAGSLASSAFVTTHFAAATAMLGWTAIEWFRHGKPSVLGAISGAVAGLVCITPGAGFVTPMSALFIGLLAGIGCYFMVTEVKSIFGYDDTLDVFGIHGFGGTLGAILTGVFATKVVNPIFKDVNGTPLPVGFIDGNGAQILNQLMAIALTVAIAMIGTFVILKIVDLVIGIRVSADEEIEGLDLTQHGETAYAFELKESINTSVEPAVSLRHHGDLTGNLAIQTK